MKSFLSIPSLFVFLVAAPLASAAFNPGPNPIDGTVTVAQTLSSGTGTIASTGTLQVSGSSVAITITGASTIENNGNVSQIGSARGIRDNTGGFAFTINNNAGAIIQTAADDVIQSGKAGSNPTVNNAGTITALGGGQAIDWNNITTGANTLHNLAGGLIEAFNADAVRPGVNGIITNAGTIRSSTNNGDTNDGIDTQNNSGVNITNNGSGLIEGTHHGLTGGDETHNITLSVTNTLGATIKGDDGSGINVDGTGASEVVTIMNDGAITGNGVTGDGDAVDVDGVVNLTNTGTIKSLNSLNDVSEGVTVGGGTITNSGLIEGDIASGNSGTGVGRGITLAGVDKDANGNTIPPMGIYANSIVTNSGTIRGQSDSGIAVLGPATGFTVTINNNAGGLIEGGGATAAAIQTGADNDTVNNAGQIVADLSNLAVDLGAGNDVLNVTGGAASITGDISGGTGTNSLSIDPGAGHGFSYTGVISNFASAEIKSGTVTLSGASTYTGTTTVSGGTLLAHNSTGSATGSGQVTVQNAATLGGDGRIGGDVLVQSGGRISPGLSPGNLRLDANLTITDGARFVFQLGPDSDLVTVAGTLGFSGSGEALVDVQDAGITAGDDYTLITFGQTSGLTLSNFTLGETPAGFSGTLALEGNALTLHVNAVPEPASVFLFAAGAGVLLALLRRPRRDQS